MLFLLCVPAETNIQDRVFIVHLGNIPHDVTVEKVQVNLKPLPLEGAGKGGYSFTSMVHTNGSRAVELRLPFLHDAVRLTVRMDQSPAQVVLVVVPSTLDQTLVQNTNQLSCFPNSTRAMVRLCSQHN